MHDRLTDPTIRVLERRWPFCSPPQEHRGLAIAGEYLRSADVLSGRHSSISFRQNCRHQTDVQSPQQSPGWSTASRLAGALPVRDP